MGFIIDVAQYIIDNFSEFLTMTIEHVSMVALALLFALIVGIPLGVLAAKVKKLAPFILTVVNIIQIIPSLAILAFLMILIGLGFKSVVIGLFLYSLLPIVRNTYVGLQQVDADMKEVGTGLGMNKFQLLTKVELPLSIPFLLAGLRVAAVVAIAVACIGPYIGGGGFGNEIISGISHQNNIRIYAGTIPPAIMAILVDFILTKLEKRVKNQVA